MRCAILGCPNVYVQRNQPVSFHGFPNNPNVLTVWVSATGIPDFIPTNRSKVCSDHFDRSAYECTSTKARKKLKPQAIPTLFLPEDASERVSGYKRKHQEYDPTAGVLNTNKPVTLMQDNVPSSHNFPTQSETVNTIKVVDLEKLLQPQKKQPVGVQKNIESKTVTKDSPILHSILSKYCSSTESFVNSTGITASQVLACLRVILPGKFDLTRMIPNEKVASLVIRYLKKDEKNEQIHNVVKDHLKIIIEAAKGKDNKSFNHTTHPYSKINDRDLKNALALILPENFSMIHITDELLRLICVTLNLDICTDAYYILIRKIRKFTSEGQKFSEILNCDNKVCDDSLEVEKDMVINKTKESATVGHGGLIITRKTSEVLCNDEQRELVFVDVNNPDGITHSPNVDPLPCGPLHVHDSSGSGHTVNNMDIGNKESIILKTDAVKTSDNLNFKTENKMPSQKADCKPEVKPKLEHIISFLHENKCSAKDVLHNFQLMFKLCRCIQHQTGSANTKNVKYRLNYIIENNIDINNIKGHLKRKPSHLKKITGNKSTTTVDLSNDAKLKTKPVVFLRDFLGFRPEQLLFMRREKVKSNGFCNTPPLLLSSNKNPPNKKYSSEQVKELTEDSFKQFRRIVMKRNGNKASFVVKFATLLPGTVVYAKNFRHPEVGWVKGLVNKPEGPLKYEVKLDNGSLWSCTVDQLRPVLIKF